jgi:hypothetical protein
MQHQYGEQAIDPTRLAILAEVAHGALINKPTATMLDILAADHGHTKIVHKVGCGTCGVGHHTVDVSSHHAVNPSGRGAHPNYTPDNYQESANKNLQYALSYAHGSRAILNRIINEHASLMQTLNIRILPEASARDKLMRSSAVEFGTNLFQSDILVMRSNRSRGHHVSLQYGMLHVHDMDESAIWNDFNQSTILTHRIRGCVSIVTQDAMKAWTSSGAAAYSAGGCYQAYVPAARTVSVVCELERNSEAGTAYNISCAANPDDALATHDDASKKTVVAYAATPVGIVAGAVHAQLDALRARAQHSDKWCMLMTAPIRIPNAIPKYLGGSASPESFMSVPYPARIMRKINYVVAPPKAELDGTPINIDVKSLNEIAEAARSFDAEHGVVDLRGELLAIAPNDEVLETHQVGANYSTYSCKARIMWPNCDSKLASEVQLAPAFAGLANTWLDRSMISTLSSALAWTGSGRASDIDPQTRTALRIAANSSVELTRYYVRAYAMLIAAAEAASCSKTYAPRTTNNLQHISCEADTIISWGTALAQTALTGGNGLFFDAHALSHVDDLYNVLAMITAPRLVNAGTADWLWPTIQGAALYTNFGRLPRLNDSIHYSLIEAAISWLACSTNTARQAEEAKKLVMQLAMRPPNGGIFGLPLPTTTTSIALPKTATAGQMLLPFTLWATTNEFDETPVGHPSNAETVLRSAACLGAAFIYSIQLAAAACYTPKWWAAVHAQSYDKRQASTQLVRRGTWFIAQLAAEYRSALGPFSGSIWSAGLWPHKRDALAKLAHGLHDSSHANLLLSPNCLSNDPGSAKFLKSVFSNKSDEVPIGQPMLINHILSDVSSAAAAAALLGSGAHIGYGEVAPTTGALTNMAWVSDPAKLTGALLPSEAARWIKVKHLIIFPTWKAYSATRRRMFLRAQCTWHAVHTNHATAAHMFAASGPESGDDAMGSAGSFLPKPPPCPTPSDSGSDTTSSETTPTSGVIRQSDQQVPRALKEHARTDPLIAALCAAENTPLGPRYPPSAYTTRDWVLQPQLADDDESLNWLAEHIRPYYATRQGLDPTNDIPRIHHTIMEQIRLNHARKKMPAIERGETRAEINEEIAAITECVLPKDQGLPASASGQLDTPASAHQGVQTSPDSTQIGHIGPATQSTSAVPVAQLPLFSVATTL